MIRLLVAISLAVSLSAAPAAAQQKEKREPAKSLKAGKDEKVCNYRFPSGEKRQWVCKKVEPCCAWDAISYVKCGSTITGCF